MATEDATIKTFVVFDLETNGLPCHQFNKCSITEICLFAFSSKHVKENDDFITKDSSLSNEIKTEDGIELFSKGPPVLPRVLHKLTLMINPMRMIDPGAERVTGLSNDMLCNESPFDKTTAECLLNFLERLESPVCMIAHNGWHFDFPVIRHVLEKIHLKMPSAIFCIDSFKAFREIDDKRDKLAIETEKHIKATAPPPQLEELQKDFTEIIKDTRESSIVLKNFEKTKLNHLQKEQTTAISDPLEENLLINWQLSNETTPHRRHIIKAEKRSVDSITSSFDIEDECPSPKRSSLNVRRSLFTDNYFPAQKYPKKGQYKLGNMYKRIFNEEPKNLHNAEADVEILSKLVLHYGLDFLAYAEERKKPWSEVPKLGASTNF